MRRDTEVSKRNFHRRTNCCRENFGESVPFSRAQRTLEAKNSALRDSTMIEKEAKARKAFKEHSLNGPLVPALLAPCFPAALCSFCFSLCWLVRSTLPSRVILVLICFRTYLWFDEKGKKTRVAAPQYIDYVMTFTQRTVSDETIFPTKYGKRSCRLQRNGVTDPSATLLLRNTRSLVLSDFRRVMSLRVRREYFSSTSR